MLKNALQITSDVTKKADDNRFKLPLSSVNASGIKKKNCFQLL